MDHEDAGRQVCPSGKETWARIERDAEPFGVTVIRTVPMRLVCTSCAKVWKPLTYDGRGIDFECHGCTKRLAGKTGAGTVDLTQIVSAVTQAIEDRLGGRLKTIEEQLEQLKLAMEAERSQKTEVKGPSKILLTYDELSEATSLSVAYLKELKKRGEIPAVHIGRRVRFHPADTLAAIQKHRRGKKAPHVPRQRH